MIELPKGVPGHDSVGNHATGGISKLIDEASGLPEKYMTESAA